MESAENSDAETDEHQEPFRAGGIDRLNSTRQWNVFGSRIPKGEIVFFCQIGIIYVVIISCIVNLTRQNGDSNLWTALLSGCLGYIIPSPSIKRYSP